MNLPRWISSTGSSFLDPGHELRHAIAVVPRRRAAASHLRPLQAWVSTAGIPPHPLALDIFGRDAPQLPRHPMPASRRRASRGSAMAYPPQSTPAFRDPGFGFALTPHTLTDPFHSDSSPAQCERAHAGGRRRAGPPLAVASPVRAPNRLPVATSVLCMPCG